MSTMLVNGLAALIMAAIVIAFELGGLAPADAFFGVSAVLVVFTAYQFMGHDGAPLGQAIRAVFGRPKGQNGQLLSYLTFVSISGVGLFVAIQALTTV